jgi:type VI secretion system protein ImpK
MSQSQSMYWVCSDVLSPDPAAQELARPAGAGHPAASSARLFETMMQNGREARIPEQDMIDAKFALAAFADEVIYPLEWPGKTQWLSTRCSYSFSS